MRRDFVLAILPPGWQHPATMTTNENPFSPARAAASNGPRARAQSLVNRREFLKRSAGVTGLALAGLAA